MSGSEIQTKTKENAPSNNTTESSPTLNPPHGGDSNPNTQNLSRFTDEQLEDLLLKRLDTLYNEALVKLISSGYHRDVALRAILTNGHGFGKSDILTNIVQNSLSYLDTGMILDNGTYRQGKQVFADMRTLIRDCLTVMISLLRQVRPNLTKREIMWILLMTKFNLSVASNIKVPFATKAGEGKVSENDNSPVASSGLSELEGDKDSSKILERDLKLPKRLNLTPSLAFNLRKNVADYAAAYGAQVKVSPEPPRAVNNSWQSKKPTEQFEWEESLMVKSVLGSFGSLSLDQDTDGQLVDPKVETISSLVDQIKVLKKQVQERKEWAHKRVVQAARKMNNDLTELRNLRMERKEKQLDKNCKLETDETAKKRLMEMDNALKETNCQADLVNAAVKRLQMENAEIRAEMEALKLSSSESDKIFGEAVKKESKFLKRIMALEKQNNKLQEEIEEEKKKFLHMQQQLICLQEAQDDIEVRRRQELQAKELAITGVQEELRLKEEAAVNLRREQEAICRKMELHCRCCKDDIQRLEWEISCHQKSLDSSVPHHLPDILYSELELVRPERDTFGTVHPDLLLVPDISGETCNRICLICKEKEASIVFLPCRDQVVCTSCTEDDCKNVEDRCPCCEAPISQRIRVFGTGS